MEACNISKLKFSSLYTYKCVRNGSVVWEIEKENMVTNEGLDYVMDLLFKPEGYESPQFYCGLIAQSFGAAPSPEDTMDQKGWPEYTHYSTSYRELLLFDKTGNATHTSSPANFHITKNSIVRGAFMTTDDVKGGTEGHLYGASYFQINREVEKGDTLHVTIQVSATGA